MKLHEGIRAGSSCSVDHLVSRCGARRNTTDRRLFGLDTGRRWYLVVVQLGCGTITCARITGRRTQDTAVEV